MKDLSVVYDELSTLRWCCIEIYVGKGLVYFRCQDAVQFLQDALFMLKDLFTDLLLLIYLDSLGDAVHYVDYEAEAEGVKGEVTSCYVLCFYLLQFDCAAEDNKLVADRVVIFKELVYLYAYLLAYKGVELGDMEIVLYNFHQKKQGLCHFIDLALYDNLISNDPKIPYYLIPIIHDTFLLHTIKEHA